MAWLGCAALLWLPIQAQAQTPQATVPPSAASAKTDAGSGEPATKLAAPVHLLLGDVSVAQFTSALSEQTGLTISAAPYLRDRRILVQMDDVSAQNALNALAEMNDWTWRETQPGEIGLFRRALKLPREPGYIPRFVQTAIPADLREYMRVLRPSDKLHNDDTPAPKNAPASIDIFLRIVDAHLDALHELRATLSIPDLCKKPLSYARLSAAQQTLLLSTYVYGYFSNIHDTLLQRDIAYPYVDPGSCQLTYSPQNRDFRFESRNPRRPLDNTFVFGALIVSDKPEKEAAASDDAKPE